ncbi:MAG: NifU family protein [Phycisphaerales bacterium]|nr:NifU family protein [Phycisphaerales bacterium]
MPDTDPSILRSGDLFERVRRVIDLIRPAVQADGGDLELVELTSSGTVRIRFHGACVGCPSSEMTLQMGVERNLRQHVPEVKRVEAIP